MMHKKGFTLIEVVVVIAIIGIASSIILVSIGNGRTRQQVEGDARRLAGIVRELQNNALAGKQIVPGQVTCAFSLPAAAVGATTLTPRYFYRNGSSCGSALSAVLPAFRFSPGVAISVANGGIRFAVPWGKCGMGQPPLR